ncbi:MAG: cytochrome-c oxidase, cbb3-type subunit III [Bauldia sp.]|nr:cytochrome-c oxidase, cbb3-type subunit III [Bauldia sp.]
MAEKHATKVDSVTGVATTGHEWDGLEELNSPLPRWWLWTFYACILFSVGYWVVYPAWPLVWSATNGIVGWNSRSAVTEELAALASSRGPMVAELTKAEIADIGKNPALLDFTLAYGRVAFKENCAPCHGAGGGGAVGYPNLVDDDWLWGGDADAIAQTIAYGVRNTNADSRVGDMPAFGRDGILSGPEISNVAEYVRSLSGLEIPEGSDLQAGATIFADNCAACHGDEGKGNRELGAPSLTDAVWLYGSSTPAVVNTVTNARNSSMPAWSERLDPTSIKALTLYVHSLGGGE